MSKYTAFSSGSKPKMELCWTHVFVVFLLHPTWSKPQIFSMEVMVDNHLLSFEGDLTLSDFGAKKWCISQVAADVAECTNALASAVPDTLNRRKNTPQTLVDESASSSKHSIFDAQGSCTDHYHVIGRCLLLNSLARYVVDGKVPGDYVEAGVHIGDSAASIAQVILAHGSMKKMYLYDSFSGMPEASLQIDGSYALSLSPSGNEAIGKGWGHEASAIGVLNRLTSLGLNENQILIREGWFNETFKTEPKPHHKVSFLMVDGDWYESVLDTLVNFYDDVSEGGVIVIDDFGYWEGARKALWEFLRVRPDVDMPLFERYGPDILWWVKGAQHNRP